MISSHPTLRFRDIAHLRINNPLLTAQNTKVYCTYNARSAIYQLFRMLPADKGNTILLPAFHCPTIVEATVRAGYRIRFYRITRDLLIDRIDLCDKLSSDVAAVIVINYCGFPAEIDYILELKQKYNYYVVEDCAHSFLTGLPGILSGSRGDIAILSFYKLVPSYAGGGLRINIHDFPFQLAQHGFGFIPTLIALKRLIEQVIDNSPEGILKKTFQYLERSRVKIKKSIVPDLNSTSSSTIDPYSFDGSLASAKMPWFSRAILHFSKFERIVSTRQHHFEILHSNIQENTHLKKIFTYLPDYVCPWAFPVLVNERPHYDYLLRERGIPLFTFGEILHPLVYECTGDILSDAKYLSHNLMMIPLHQNLDVDTILSFCEELNKFFSNI
jgi:perosamine synthetase